MKSLISFFFCDFELCFTSPFVFNSCITCYSFLSPLKKDHLKKKSGELPFFLFLRFFFSSSFSSRLFVSFSLNLPFCSLGYSKKNSLSVCFFHGLLFFCPLKICFFFFFIFLFLFLNFSITPCSQIPCFSFLLCTFISFLFSFFFFFPPFLYFFFSLLLSFFPISLHLLFVHLLFLDLVFLLSQFSLSRF